MDTEARRVSSTSIATGSGLHAAAFHEHAGAAVSHIVQHRSFRAGFARAPADQLAAVQDLIYQGTPEPDSHQTLIHSDNVVVADEKALHCKLQGCLMLAGRDRAGGEGGRDATPEPGLADMEVGLRSQSRGCYTAGQRRPLHGGQGMARLHIYVMWRASAAAFRPCRVRMHSCIQFERGTSVDVRVAEMW
jgi:hypothetical protein